MENRSIDELKAGFDNFWMQKLLPYQQELEKTRKKYLRIFLLQFCLVALISVAMFLWLLDVVFEAQARTGKHACLLMFVIIFILMILDIPYRLIQKFRKEAKNRFMPQLIKYFDGFSFKFGVGISSDTISKSKLRFAHHVYPDEYFSDIYKPEQIAELENRIKDDYFTGVYKNVDIKVSEEQIKHVNNIIFQGVFVVLTINKKFDGQTMVVSDNGIFNNSDRLSMFLNGRENIRLEDSVFEKEFEVYGTNQIEARYLLTPAFMERILKLRQAYKSKRIEFSFFDDKLFIAISLKKDMFESASLFHSCLDRKPIDETFNQILSIIEIVDILKLDTLKISN